MGVREMDDFHTSLNTKAELPDSPFEARHFIGGVWRDGGSGKRLERHSPAHAELVSVSAVGRKVDATDAVIAARNAFDSGIWSRLPARQRAEKLNIAADLIENNVERIALMDSLESGKPITQARAEAAGAADLWRYAASLSRSLGGDSHNQLGDEFLGMVLREPIGVVSIITPWNFPFWILSQKLPFALAAGCTCVVKPSEFAPSSTAIAGEILEQAGLPAGAVNIVLGHAAPVGQTLATHQFVDMVSFTGSTAVGKRISADAADTLKKVVLELGGKNPQVVFADADLDDAADAIVFGAYFNAGECCNAGSRVIVHEDVHDELVQKVVTLSKHVVFGDPLDPSTQVGAIISPEHLSRIHTHVEAAVAEGAKIELGGDRLDMPGLPGAFYKPTLLSGVLPDMPIARDEVFGPVATFLRFEDINGAIGIVNDVAYGLSAGVWSRDVHTCLEFSRRAAAGTIWTNTWMDGFPELTFGGMKQSGQGREIGRAGLEEFLEVKTVVMRIGQTRKPWVKRSDVRPEQI